MKKNCWILFGALLSTRLLAQQVTNAPLAAPIETPPPAPAVTAPPVVAPEAAPAAEPKPSAPAATPGKKKAAPKAKKKAEKKPVAKKKESAAELKTVPLVAGPAEVVARHVNLRGQPRLSGEVLARLEKGQPVTVVEEITHNNSGPDEPSAWAKVLLPTNAPVWVSSAYIDPTNKTVIPKKLNLRGGPGENYSILGRLERGEAVTEITTKGEWTQIQTPTNAYGFVAAQYLKQEAPGAIVSGPAAIASAEVTNTPAAPAEPPAVATTVAEGPTIASTTTETPLPASTNAASETAAAPVAAVETPALTNTPPAAPVTSTEPAAPVAEEPPPKRIVEHEGLVRGATSIQAPSHFALISPENGQVINYLYTTSTNLDLRRYKGMRIVVTGEEGLDERWRNTPVIKIQKIQVVE